MTTTELSKINTMEEFLERLRIVAANNDCDIELDYWLKILKRETDEEEGFEAWLNFLCEPLGKENVVLLADALKETGHAHALRLDNTFFVEMIIKIHELMRLIFFLAFDQGIQIKLMEIDGSISFCEKFEAEGLIIVNRDGNVVLTELGQGLIEKLNQNLF